jgi:hypothetical protein
MLFAVLFEDHAEHADELRRHMDVYLQFLERNAPRSSRLGRCVTPTVPRTAACVSSMPRRTSRSSGPFTTIRSGRPDCASQCAY